MHPGIFDNFDRLWNLDETQISAENGRSRKVFTNSNSSHRGFVAQNCSGKSKHVTSIVAVSAGGKIAPPFIVIEGRNVMKSWFEPMSYERIRMNPDFFWLSSVTWFPQNDVVVMSDNGSMEMRLIKLLIQHVNKFVRKFIPDDLAYCLTLDGHSSRNGFAWLEYCHSVRCEFVQLPSDTSHFYRRVTEWSTRLSKVVLKSIETNCVN